MKAAVYRKFGPPEVVRIENVKKPAPKKNEVLIKIHATTVSAGDWRARSLTVPKGFGLMARILIFGLLRPRHPILGSELAGEIEAVGTDVTKFKVGDQVFAFPGFGRGCHAEYTTMPEEGRIAPKPANLSFEEAAAISFGGTTALGYLRDKAKIQKGERVLIVGAPGTVGSAAVQLAKHFGAEVTGVCSTANLELVRSIGADRAIDYTKEDFTQSGETYDIILDATGDASFPKCENALKPGGRLLLAVANPPQMLEAAFGSKPDNKKVLAGHANVAAADLRFLKQLCEAGQFKPVIDRCLPLEKIVEAHARVDTGRKTGSVVITISHDD
ncbi:MAG: NAD(P)-dependent alcohol dehydrogenase [Rhodomicrobium sp.]